MTNAVCEEYRTILSEKLPRRIANAEDYAKYRAEISGLMETEVLDEARSAYLDLIVALVEAYERETVKLPEATPLEVLRELMDARGMKQAEFARLFTNNSSGLASEICNGSRAISKDLAKKLARHFNVSAAVFI